MSIAPATHATPAPSNSPSPHRGRTSHGGPSQSSRTCYSSSCQQQTALRAALTADAPQTPDHLVAQVHASLKAAPADIRATLDELLAEQPLVEEGPHLRPTDAGRAVMAAVTAQTAPVSARVWAGIPADDLAAAGRVLTLVRRRADAELAALTG
ncbi:MarR family transcriptional regulator [Streptomyces sp. SP17BM10]|uniref:MarR family transcriptional regulator n=1 Tax=Streptomyces sp. SP17BM10 TaxID=3002530 RepID=UPI002E776751|nr:MarR family transcriptional regulator [Streptomyces sp. SP17BM10]MEE1782901.1 MarR family transcriptional regulator [Streptomyces sp. SP17BM10]